MAASASASSGKPPGKVYNNRTTFVLGHDKADWSTDAKDAYGSMPADVDMDDRKLAATLAAKQRVTSVHLGSTTTDYSTDYGDAFVTSADAIASAKPPAVDRDLRKTNFSLGVSRCDFETDYSAAFSSKEVDVEAQNKERGRSKEVREELRRTHFSLGEEAADWSTTMGDASSTGHAMDPKERAKNKAELAEFRRELGRLHFSLGHESKTDYRTTTAMPAVDTKANLVKPVKVHTHRTNFVLGEERLDYRSQAMVMTGQERVKLHDPYMPRRDGSWKKRLTGGGASASAGSA